MQLHLECTTSGAIVNYQSGGPSSAHDGGAAFLFALAIARHVHSHLSQWVRRAQVYQWPIQPERMMWAIRAQARGTSQQETGGQYGR